MRLKDFNDRIERERQADRMASASDLAMITKVIAMGRASGTPASVVADQIKAPAHISSMLKAAVGSGTMADFAPYRAMATRFIGTLQTRSIFIDLLLNGSLNRAPLQTPIRSVSVALTGSLRTEGTPAPIGRMTLASPILHRRNAVGLLVLSKEVVNSSENAGLAFIESELRKVVAVSTDSAFLTVIAEGVTPIVASGTDSDAALADLKRMLDVVNVANAGDLVWALSPDTANAGAVMTNLAGGFTFPDLGPKGGSVLSLPAYVTSAVPRGSLFLIDPAGIVGEAENVDIRGAEEAAVRMRDDPENTGAALVSLWQTNAIAIRASLVFGAERFRSSAVAVLENINWGGASS